MTAARRRTRRGSARRDSSSGPTLPTWPISAPASIGSSSSATSPGLPLGLPAVLGHPLDRLVALELVGEVHVQRVELDLRSCRASCSWRSSTKLNEPIAESLPIRAATSRPGYGANTPRVALADQVDRRRATAAVSPHGPTGKNPPSARCLVELVELLGGVLELAAVVGDDRLVLVLALAARASGTPGSTARRAACCRSP